MPVVPPPALDALEISNRNIASFERSKRKEHRDLVEDFINTAPDAKRKQKTSFDEKGRKLKGHKIVITVTLDPDLLDRLNDIAQSLGMTRTGFINMIIRKEVDARI